MSLQTHTSPLPLPPFYFVMRNFDHYQKHNYIFASEPFYTHPGGYKMAVAIYTKSDDEGKGTHLSIYLDILRGEFDDKLQWPFDGEVTVQAYNRTTRQWSMEQTFILNKRKCDLSVVSRRVDAMAATSWGYNDLLPLSELKRDYVKHINAVRFRVTNVKICT